MNNEDVLDLFIGTKVSYDKFKSDNHIVEDEPQDKNEEESESSSTVHVLSKETIEPIDDETMKILKRTRIKRDYETVYMQSSLEFYDEFYNNEDVIPDELKGVRQIRRVYKIYPDYLKAVELREAYIDYLVEKNGGEDQFLEKMNMGMIKDWIPRMPILSRKCPDYSLYLAGEIPMEKECMSEEQVREVWEAHKAYYACDDIEVTCCAEDRIGVINKYLDKMSDNYPEWNNSSSSNGFNSVTFTDLKELSNIFNSWYQKDESSNTGEIEVFKNAPENLRKRYAERRNFNEPGLLAKMMSGDYDPEPELDMNEMVYDNVTGRNMTRAELYKREDIRLMAKAGWSESRMLHYQKVGSKLDSMKRRRRVGKKKKRSSTEYDDSLNDPYGLNPMYSDNEYMSNSFLSLMRGDMSI